MAFSSGSNFIKMNSMNNNGDCAKRNSVLVIAIDESQVKIDKSSQTCDVRTSCDAKTSTEKSENCDDSSDEEEVEKVLNNTWASDSESSSLEIDVEEEEEKDEEEEEEEKEKAHNNTWASDYESSSLDTDDELAEFSHNLSDTDIPSNCSSPISESDVDSQVSVSEHELPSDDSDDDSDDGDDEDENDSDECQSDSSTKVRRDIACDVEHRPKVPPIRLFRYVQNDFGYCTICDMIMKGKEKVR